VGVPIVDYLQSSVLSRKSTKSYVFFVYNKSVVRMLQLLFDSIDSEGNDGDEEVDDGMNGRVRRLPCAL
jgi:hypothetical protein